MDLLTGFVSSSIAVYTVQPLDTVKTQFQSGLLNNNNKRIPQIASDIYKLQGIKGFYKGSLSMISTYPIFWSVFFQIKGMKIISSENKFVDSITNTAIASSVASIVTNPLFVLKTRKQTDSINNREPTKYGQKIKNIFIKEGISGFFRGTNTTLFSNGKLGMQFPLYDYILQQTDQYYSTVDNFRGTGQRNGAVDGSDRTGQRNGAVDGSDRTGQRNGAVDGSDRTGQRNGAVDGSDRTGQVFIASFISKLLANSVFYPTDIIRTIQRDNIKERKTILGIARELYAKHGIRGFYRGIMIYNMVSCPNFVIMMLLKKQFDKFMLPRL